MKIDRLMGLVVYLLKHGRTSAQKLAEEFEVSSRTIMRDLESLDQAGIPIQAFYGVDGGYQIMDSYVLEKQAVTRNEYDWLVTALKGMASAYASRSLERTLAKIESLNERGNNAVSVDLSVAAEDEEIKGLLKLLEDGDLYGYQMIAELRRRSDDTFRLKAGTLYPLLHSLEEKGFVTAYEQTAESGKTRRYYHLTKQGRSALQEKETAWNAYARAVGRVLKGGACLAGA